MDYILHKINQRISLLQVTGDNGSIGVHYRSRIEYFLNLMLGYLWNKNFESLDEDEKIKVFGDILCPTIGTVVSVCRTLDVQKEIFSVKQVAKCIDKYPDLRNSQMGHGFVFEDAKEASDSKYAALYDDLTAITNSFFEQDKMFVFVQGKQGNIYKGIQYKADGDVRPWSLPLELADLKEGCLYIQYQDAYHCVSPFVSIQDAGDSLYIYAKTTEKLLGRIRYNKLINTGSLDCVWEPFSHLYVLNDGVKIKSSNGTIINIYDNNYTTYIDVGVQSQILKFLKENKASVCATLWGHGGIGKTATIQNVCDILSNKEYKTFDYIVFVSAKDRRYNYYKGIVEDITTSISTYSDVIRFLNTILFDEDFTDEKRIVGFEGKMLLVLDDFETFAKEEAKLLSDFISSLDINHHKVVVTTRSANVSLGFEIKTNELDITQASDFLMTLINNESIPLTIDDEKQLKTEAIRKRVHEITSGRPLFIYQLGHIIGQCGLQKALTRDIKKDKPAVEFLYGRIYDYLSPKAKDLFVVISLLVTRDDLINVLAKAQYIINMENDEDGFNSAVEELKKLKIVKITDDENKYFEVYSPDILEMMTKHFSMRDANFIKNSNNRRTQVNKDKNADIEQSLLDNANSSRLVKSEIETVDSYKQILNRPSCPLDTKMAAIFNLANYLIADRGKKVEALDVFDKYSHFFTGVDCGKEGRPLYAQYALRWATTYWANGSDQQKQKAINILSDYYKGHADFHKIEDLEITSTLLMYRSIMVIKAWRELKDKMDFNEIPYSDFRTKREEQIKECQSLLMYIGNPLYLYVSKMKLTELSSRTKQSLITAFFNYVDVLVRIKKIDLAIEICDYVIMTGPKNFQSQFNSKKNWLTTIK